MKFLVLYHVPVSAAEQMAAASAEQVQASMKSWMDWRSAHPELTIEFRAPLNQGLMVSADGVADSSSDITGYSYIEGESREAVIEACKTHPLLQQPTEAKIEILEHLPMPGME